MANIQERRNKDGKLISYSIRVHRGRGADGKQLKPYTTTFEVSPTWTEKSARKKAEAFAATFEKECKSGLLSDSRQMFATYCEYVFDFKESRGKKHATIYHYRKAAKRINPYIGHIKLKDLRVDHLNDLYTQLSKVGGKQTPIRCTANKDIKAILKSKKLTRAAVAHSSGVSVDSINNAVAGKTVGIKIAQAVADACGMELKTLFTVCEVKEALAPSTIHAIHGVISAVLDQAVKERLIPFNPASLAELPRAEGKSAQYFQPAEIAAIRDALEKEPIKWKTLVHMFLITGARRGEILGLKWDAVDFKNGKIHICNNLLYASDVGIYETSLKTTTSDRFIALPQQTMALLASYKMWQNRERQRLGEYYIDRGFVFARDDGEAINPARVTNWMQDFSKRHNLPHIHPHAFRHTMASMLYFNGMDSVSISKRLGHAQVSTTTDIYAHVIEEADQKNADILADIFLKRA